MIKKQYIYFKKYLHVNSFKGFIEFFIIRQLHKWYAFLMILNSVLVPDYYKEKLNKLRTNFQKNSLL